MKATRFLPAAVCAMSLALAGIAAADEHSAHHAASPPASDKAPMFQDRGSWHMAIATKSPEAQSYFDQGMRLMFGFNLEEAERSFEQAEKLDPNCAMCAWGTAFSLGPHINLPALPDRTVKANAAAQRAMKLSTGARPLEKALIEAMAKRYADPAPTKPDTQAKLDQAYADAMRDVMQRFPDDMDVATLWVEAAMDLHPWDLYTPEGEPKPWTPEIVSTLEKILTKVPNHMGANHFYIHAVEASKHPEKALPSAKQLETASPGDGHLVHMPSHIYKRVGMYGKSAEWNRKAILADERYRSIANPQGFYLMYVAHNHQFLMASCWMSGRYREAIKESRMVTEILPLDMLRQMPGFDLVIGYPIWTQARFGKWKEVLEEPAPPADFAYARAVWHAARALAHASLGQPDDAARDRDSLSAIAAVIPAEAIEGLNPAKSLLEIAQNLVQGVMAAKRGETDAAVGFLTEGAKLEDQLRYDEPSDWYFPVRHALGAVLLEAGRAKEAQAVYEADLQHNPDNGWSLTGLANSLKAQKMTKESENAGSRAAKALRDADTKVAASWM